MGKIAIYGFGRIGRQLLRAALQNGLFVPYSISDKLKMKPPWPRCTRLTQTISVGMSLFKGTRDALQSVTDKSAT